MTTQAAKLRARDILCVNRDARMSLCTLKSLFGVSKRTLWRWRRERGLPITSWRYVSTSRKGSRWRRMAVVLYRDLIAWSHR